MPASPVPEPAMNYNERVNPYSGSCGERDTTSCQEKVCTGETVRHPHNGYHSLAIGGYATPSAMPACVVSKNSSLPLLGCACRACLSTVSVARGTPCSSRSSNAITHNTMSAEAVVA